MAACDEFATSLPSSIISVSGFWLHRVTLFKSGITSLLRVTQLGVLRHDTDPSDCSM
jgi:hypothetical protein